MEVHWTRGPTIGRGSSATVSTAVCCHSGEVFAVKSAEFSQSESLQKEQRILSSLSFCPYVVGYKGFDITRENNKLMYNLHLEYAAGGSLSDEIRRNKGKLDEGKISYYTRHILQGLQFLHSHGLVHCDIKTKNVLIGKIVAKIADFGCVTRADQAEAAVIGGTPMFMAPEVARGEEQGCPSDIWALGCTVIEMATGNSPWRSFADPASVLYRIAYSNELPEIPNSLSEQAKDFLGKCLTRDPRERWTAAQLLEHPFLAGVNSTTKQIQDSETCSPTSILDQGIWSSVEESESIENSVCESSFDCPAERIRLLSRFSREPSWENDDESWLTIRGNDCNEENASAEDAADEDDMTCCSASSSSISHGTIGGGDFSNLEVGNIRCKVESHSFGVCKYVGGTLDFSNLSLETKHGTQLLLSSISSVS